MSSKGTFKVPTTYYMALQVSLGLFKTLRITVSRAKYLIKLVFGVPRSTFTYLVEGFFASSYQSLRNQETADVPQQGGAVPGQAGQV